MFSYLALSPYLVHTGVGEYLGMDVTSGGGGEFAAALGFMKRHPGVWYDVLGFAMCGAVGQVFICGSLFALSFTRTCHFCDVKEEANETSLHTLDILIAPSRDHHRYAQNAHHDSVRRMVWTYSRG